MVSVRCHFCCRAARPWMRTCHSRRRPRRRQPTGLPDDLTTERTALQAGIDFIVPVWGTEYTRCFTEICLPTFLASGNIPALPYADRHAFHVYTTPRDQAAIEVSPSYR